MDAIDKHKEEKPREGEARPVTYEMFVEMLDLKDSFSSKLVEILVKVSLLPESPWSTTRLTEIFSNYSVANRNTRNATSAGPLSTANYTLLAEPRNLSTSSRVALTYTQTPSLVQPQHSGADDRGSIMSLQRSVYPEFYSHRIQTVPVLHAGERPSWATYSLEIHGRTCLTRS